MRPRVLIGTGIIVLAALLSGTAAAQTFTEMTSAGLAGVQYSTVAWADADGDGDLDLLITGRDNSLTATSRLYTNDGAGNFTLVGTGFVGVEFGATAWGDYDNDGDPDLLITGLDDLDTPVTRLYRNDAGSFTSIPASLPGVTNGALAWGDYDNDGDLDLCLTGRLASTVPIARLYRNDAGTFVDTGTALPGVENSSVAWGDFDNDHDPDLLITGMSTGATRIARVYRNDGGSFVDLSVGLVGIERGTSAWCDYDADGDLDIALSGSSAYGAFTAVYRQDSPTVFSDIRSNIQGVQNGSLDWGDYDNDGDPDLLLTGSDDTLTRMACVYRNDGTLFTKSETLPTPVRSSAARWGDFDDDGRLDIVLTGQDALGMGVAKAYRNGVALANLAPTRPGVPNVQLVGTTANFSWAMGSDTETPARALTYNIRVGTSPGGSQIVSGMAVPATGYHRIVQQGNVGSTLGWTLKLPSLGAYYWSVQSIDAGLRVSTFTSEQSFSTSFADIATSLDGISDGVVTWGDYDNDQDLDLAVLGSAASGAVTRIYRNDSGSFVLSGSLDGVTQGAAAWGDCDNDGDLDLLVSGYSATSSTGVTRVYRNTSGTFTDAGFGLEGMYRGAVAWGDYDNDGDLDILVGGYINYYSAYARIYRNNAGSSFTDTGVIFDTMDQGSLSWLDYDNDGDLDIFETGRNSYYGWMYARLYRNDNGGFNNVVNLEPVYQGSTDWGDYDNDGDLDLLICGTSSCCGRITRIYRNTGGSFSDVGAGLPGVDQGAARWGDYDSDGDLDIALAGTSNSGPLTRVYRNQNGTFTDTVAGLEALKQAALAWGDYDGDRDADLVILGFNASGARSAKLYRNNAAMTNLPPVSPSNLTVQLSGTTATFNWAAASDDHTPAAGLNYGLRIGSTPGGSQVLATMADPVTGTCRVAQIGNTGQRLSWAVKLPQLGTYYWSVQAQDASYSGSAFAPERSFSTPFSDINAGIENVYSSAVAWGDYDADGDLDLLLAGHSNTLGSISRIYRNDAGNFQDVNAGLLGVERGTACWGDLDEDGDLDVLIAGYSNSYGRTTRVYRNNGGIFQVVNSGLLELDYCAGALGDYDNDGDLDIAVMGYSNNYGYITRLYRNDGDFAFTLVDPGIVGAYQGSVAWGDYDNDGDLDLLITGYPYITRIYSNQGNGNFSDIGAGLPGVSQSCAAWGDYDNDGDLDVLLAGSGPLARIYRNDGGSFADIGAGLEGVADGIAAWGDYDNDGKLDALVAGYSSSYGPITRVYRNTGGGFADMAFSLPGVQTCAAAWGDCDNDGDLDILVAGSGAQPTSRIFRNNAAPVANTPPGAPTGLRVQVVGTQARLIWNRPTDSTTPAVALSYSLRIGTSPGASDIMASMADQTTGYRRVVRLGLGGSNAAWTLDLSGIPVASTLYFAVQAVDHSFAGSPFSSEAVFSGAPIISSIRDVGNDQGRQVRLQWRKSIYDAPSAYPRVTSYAIYRLVDEDIAGATPQAVPRKVGGQAPPRLATPPGTWDYVLAVPARGDESYSMIAPTLCDSTAQGVCFSVFFVSGLTANPYVYFDSEPSAGYSIDNLSPHAPQGLVATVQAGSRVHLQWGESSDEDFDYFAVYRGATTGFTPSADSRVGVTTGRSFDDDAVEASHTYFYVITAFDFAGNQSPHSNEASASLVATDAPAAVWRNALHQNGPNPFNPSTQITFELASSAHVRLEIFDATGKRIATLVEGELAAGIHAVQWNGLDAQGQRVPSGQYLCRMVTGTFTATRKMILVQ